VVSLYVIGCGFLAVSQLPTLSLKSLVFPRAYGFLAVPLFTLMIASLLIYPWETLTTLTVTYLIALPVYAHRHREPPEAGQ
jgi:CDP-diacylglycerol--serine O-phosphatidyltransferase